MKALSRFTFPYIKQQIPWKRCFITQFISVLRKKWTAKHVGNKPACWQSLREAPHRIRAQKTLQNSWEVEHLSKFHTCLRRRVLAFIIPIAYGFSNQYNSSSSIFNIIPLRKCSLKIAKKSKDSVWAAHDKQKQNSGKIHLHLWI